jgi:hypothetical protein
LVTILMDLHVPKRSREFQGNMIHNAAYSKYDSFERSRGGVRDLRRNIKKREFIG